MNGSRLKILRENQGLTQAQFSEIMGVSQQAVGKWERETASPNDEMLKRIATYFNVTIDYLLGYDESPRYYADPETAALAQELKDNPDYRVLMDATRHLKPESVKEIMAFIKYQKAKEEGFIE